MQKMQEHFSVAMTVIYELIRGSLSNSDMESKQAKSRSLSQLISLNDLDQVPRHRRGVVGGTENAGELYRGTD